MGFDRIIYEKRDGIAKIIMNRPEKLNAIDQQMGEEMDAAFQDAEEDDAVRVIVWTGTGRAFTVGADLQARRSQSYEEYAKNHLRSNVKSLERENFGKPLIAAVNGLAVVYHSMLLADIIVADEDARFRDTHAEFGGAPSRLYMKRLQETVGNRKALEVFFLCDWINAQEAKQIGLVNQVTPRGKLMDVVDEMAKKIASRNPATLRTIKQTIKLGAAEDIGALPVPVEERASTRA